MAVQAQRGSGGIAPVYAVDFLAGQSYEGTLNFL
jgi:hypothetical protein